jgi:hypothetical protein
MLVAVPLLAALVLNLGRDPHAVASPLVGRPAAPFRLAPAGGGPLVTLASLRGASSCSTSGRRTAFPAPKNIRR